MERSLYIIEQNKQLKEHKQLVQLKDSRYNDLEKRLKELEKYFIDHQSSKSKLE